MKILPLQSLVCGFSVLVFALSGCSEGPRAGRPVAGVPDDVVEYLVIDESGDVKHKEGKFLELVERDDEKLVIVDFWAEWCGPCRKLGPHLTAIKREWGDRIEVVKVDVDKAQSIASHLDVSSIPDVRIYRHGTQVSDFVGLMPREEIEALLKSLE